MPTPLLNKQVIESTFDAVIIACDGTPESAPQNYGALTCSSHSLQMARVVYQ
jgi:hypothetical protein